MAVAAATELLELEIVHDQQEDTIEGLVAVVIGSKVVGEVARTQRQERHKDWILGHCSELRVWRVETVDVVGMLVLMFVLVEVRWCRLTSVATLAVI
jgi:hypothetical protein